MTTDPYSQPQTGGTKTFLVYRPFQWVRMVKRITPQPRFHFTFPPTSKSLPRITWENGTLGKRPGKGLVFIKSHKQIIQACQRTSVGVAILIILKLQDLEGSVTNSPWKKSSTRFTHHFQDVANDIKTIDMAGAKLSNKYIKDAPQDCSSMLLIFFFFENSLS